MTNQTKIGSKEDKGTIKIKARQNKPSTVGESSTTLKVTRQTSSAGKDSANAASGSKQTSTGKAKRKAKDKEETQLQKLLKTSKMAQSSLDRCGTEAKVPEMLSKGPEDEVLKHTSGESEAVSPDFGGPSGRKVKVSPAGQPQGKKGSNKAHD